MFYYCQLRKLFLIVIWDSFVYLPPIGDKEGLDDSIDIGSECHEAYDDYDNNRVEDGAIGDFEFAGSSKKQEGYSYYDQYIYDKS